MTATGQEKRKAKKRSAPLIVTEAEGFGETDVYHVTRKDAPSYAWTHVWVHAHADGTVIARCTDCSGKLVAMKASCPHTAAVRRYIRRKAAK